MLVSIVLLFSCERDSYFMAFGEMKIVVEGWIDEGDVARVILSRSVPISELVDSSNFLEYAILSAMVVVSDGTIYDTLWLRTASQHLPPRMYVGNRIIGQAGGTYTLIIHYFCVRRSEEITLTAETTIPESVPIQNVRYVRQNPTDTTGNLVVEFIHPEGQQKYYQIATMVRHFDEVFVPSMYGNLTSRNFTSPDVEVTIMRGVSIFPRASFALYFNDGDEILVRLRTMPRKSFDFWNAWQNEIINARNVIFPANRSLPSNINGGVGIWSGYGQSTFRIVAE